MNKQEFITRLKDKLHGLPSREVEERLDFYIEMIEDRIEEGATEEDAVSEIGSVDAVSEQIIADIPLIKIAKERIKPKNKLKTWEIVLLAVGSPIWLSLLISAFAVIISLYASLWAAVASAWAVFASFIGGAVGGAIGGLVLAVCGYAPMGIAMICVGSVCAGLSILSFIGCKAATRGTVQLTKIIALFIKKCFIGKENA